MTQAFRAIRISGAFLGAVAFLGLVACSSPGDRSSPTSSGEKTSHIPPMPESPQIPPNTRSGPPNEGLNDQPENLRNAKAESKRKMVVGGLEKDMVQRVVKSHQREIKSCYERELIKNPSLAGKVTVAFTVSATGDVISARARGGTLNSQKVSDCIVGKVGGWIFPEPSDGKEVQIAYPFVFAPQQ